MRDSLDDLTPLPRRDTAGHKGTFGSAAIVGGSVGMSGALILAGRAALRSGCGLTFLHCPEPIQSILATAEPAYLTQGYAADTAGRFCSEVTGKLLDHLVDKQAVGIGPGMGQSPELDVLVGEFYQKLSLPLVVDADAINSLARQRDLLDQAKSVRIFTPHPGEMARLCDCSTAIVEENRQQIAQEFAQRYRCLLILKGSRTVVTDGTSIYLNSTGNSGLATGGSGDVLTGLLTGLLAQQIEPFSAACWATWIHGRAGDLAAEKWGEAGLIASDLPDYVALAMKEIQTI